MGILKTATVQLWSYTVPYYPSRSPALTLPNRVYVRPFLCHKRDYFYQRLLARLAMTCNLATTPKKLPCRQRDGGIAHVSAKTRNSISPPQFNLNEWSAYQLTFHSFSLSLSTSLSLLFLLCSISRSLTLSVSLFCPSLNSSFYQTNLFALSVILLLSAVGLPISYTLGPCWDVVVTE